MKTREAFKSLGVELQWSKQKVILLVGKEPQKIVCAPPAFRWLEKIVKWAIEAGYPKEEVVGVIRGSGSGCPVPLKGEKRDEYFERIDAREARPIPVNTIEDPFAHGTFILDGIGRYAGENEGGPG